MAFLDENGVAELWSLVKAEDLKIKVGSYTGGGGYGESAPNSLTFDFVPKVILVSVSRNVSGQAAWMGIMLEDVGVSIANTLNTGTNANVINQTIAEWGKTVKWYATTAGWQYNVLGATYHYVAIG